MKFVFPLQVDLARSRGSIVHDELSGHGYLDLFGLYSSLPLGYNHPIFGADFFADVCEVASVRLATNVFRHRFIDRFVRAFRPHLFSDRIHLSCTGALAVESAIKVAMERRKLKHPRVLSIENSFHGVNAWGLPTSRVGATARRMEWFPKSDWPCLPLDAAIAWLRSGETDDVVAVIVEPIQATSGDIYLAPEKLQELASIANAKGICVIMDEIQSGFGVTGRMWYAEHLGVTPDILVFGKKSQVCGLCASEEYAEIFESPFQKLDVTFDGDLIDMVRATYVLRAIDTNDILRNVLALSAAFEAALAPVVEGYRSRGCLIAFDLPDTASRDAFVSRCFASRVLVNKAGERSIRLRPHLAMRPEEAAPFFDLVRAQARW